jgi:DNA-binding NarL/FixJ family response regulator
MRTPIDLEHRSRNKEKEHIAPVSSKKEMGTKTSCPSTSSSSIVVIERRAFYRDCIVRSLRLHTDMNVLSAESVDEWLEISKHESASVIVLCSEDKDGDEATRRSLETLSDNGCSLPVVVLSDFDSVDVVVDAIGKGARGYIPTVTGFDVAVEAIKMVKAGGTFVPASSLLAARRQLDEPREQRPNLHTMFTTRQAAVVEALRMGKANKTIAYELNMCESTVKVHVRNIMKRLKARNRTQVAYLAGQLINGGKS